MVRVLTRVFLLFDSLRIKKKRERMTHAPGKFTLGSACFVSGSNRTNHYESCGVYLKSILLKLRLTLSVGAVPPLDEVENPGCTVGPTSGICIFTSGFTASSDFPFLTTFDFVAAAFVRLTAFIVSSFVFVTDLAPDLAFTTCTSKTNVPILPGILHRIAAVPLTRRKITQRGSADTLIMLNFSIPG
jgi:hypothetical protein